MSGRKAARVPSTLRLDAKPSSPSAHQAGVVVCEAFTLSNVTHALVDRQVLLLVPPSLSSSSPSKSNGDLNPVRKAGLHNGKVKLTGPVLLKHEEVTELDPVLLAVPLQVKILDQGQDGRASTMGKKGKKSRGLKGVKGIDGGTSIENVFPTVRELLEEKAAGEVAKGFLGRLFKHFKAGQAMPSDASRRLRDPHLLLHLASLFDKSVFEQLLDLVSESREGRCAVVPMELAMMVEAVRSSLLDTGDAPHG